MTDHISERRKFLTLGAAGVAAPLLVGGRARAASSPGSPRENFDVMAYGAKGDGKTIDSPAINQAIEAAAASGGGTVRFPAGTYLSFSIRLKSNIALYLDAGATILAADPAGAKGSYDLPE